jgi:hypothetical protein
MRNIYQSRKIGRSSEIYKSGNIREQKAYKNVLPHCSLGNTQ